MAHHSGLALLSAGQGLQLHVAAGTRVVLEAI